MKQVIILFLVFLSNQLPFEVHPRLAAHVVAVLHLRPDLADDLTAICLRESRCQPISVHDGDTNNDPSDGWGGQVSLGHLDPGCQPYAPDTWPTRGAWGLSAASHWKYMPRCYQPHWFDLPLVSATVSLYKVARCERRRKNRGWCRRPRSVRQNNAKGSVGLIPA